MDELKKSMLYAVDQLLGEQGNYHPLELLLRLGKLQYEDYEAWRSGEEKRLDQLLFGNLQRTLEQLAIAEQHAAGLGLHPQQERWIGWGSNSSATLNIGEPALAHALRNIWLRQPPTEEGAQYDLFFDNSELITANQVRQALAQRSVEGATSALEQLTERHPNHPDMGELELLVRALQTPPPDAATLLDNLLHHWRPLAERQLGHTARDYLRLLWGRLVEQLKHTPYNPQQPLLHNSWVALQCEAWHAARDAVEQHSEWRTTPELMDRHATASWQLGERKGATITRFQLCWSHPRYALEMVEHEQFNDSALHNHWRELVDLELESSLEEAININWLPQYSLIQSPSLFRSLHAEIATLDPASTPAGWNSLIQLLENPQEVSLRRQLQSEAALLFQLFMMLRYARGK